tara:strand:+ start:23127 stop:24449 length:1323 start_codon:yes stop_codon:yes gene_type:complete
MKKIILALVLLCALNPLSSFAKQSETVLIDAETIAWLREMADPLLKTADIDPKTVNIYVVKSNEINAFVTPDRDIFFYSGLILKATSAEEIQGVLAHEIGHIKGQHYIKTLANSDKGKIPVVLGTILGAGVAILGGGGEAATALISGGIAVSQDQYLRNSRSHERQADTIAAELLNKNNRSTQGLISFFDKLRTSNLLYSKTPPAWLVTHPLPRERISSMQGLLKNEKIAPLPPLSNMRFKRVQAKLNAFTMPGGYNLRKYAYQKTEDALYAQALSLALKGRIDTAMALVQTMNPERSSMPFHHELLGQLYQDKSEYLKAEQEFKSALEINPDLEFIRLQLAQNCIIREEYDEAIKHLHIVSSIHPTWSAIVRSLGIAYGKKGNLFESHIYLAKAAVLAEKTQDIEIHLQLAEKNMDKTNKKQQERLDNIKEILSHVKKS